MELPPLMMEILQSFYLAIKKVSLCENLEPSGGQYKRKGKNGKKMRTLKK